MQRHRIYDFVPLVFLAVTPAIAVAQRSDTTVRVAARPVHAGVATLVPEISIGVFDGADEYMFGDVVEVAVAKDGSIYVFDRQVPALRKYDANGKFVKTFGRKGQGPGEYVSGGGLAVLPDGRVLLWDTGNWRINVYSPGGELLTHLSTPSGLGGNVTMVTSRAMLVDTAGFIYLRSSIRLPRGDAGPPIGPGRQVWIRRKPDGTVVDTIEVPTFGRAARTLTATSNSGGGTASSSTNLPFDPQPAWTLSPLGHVVSGMPDRYAFEITRPGQPIVSVRRDIKPDQVTSAERKEARDRIESMMRRTDPKWNWSGPDIPGVKPFYASLTTGQDGRIWVARSLETGSPGFGFSSREASLSGVGGGRSGGAPPPAIRPGSNRSTGPAKPALFDVFEPTGVFLGQVQIPARTTIFARRGDHVWGVAYDDDDVATVKRFRIVWR